MTKQRAVLVLTVVAALLVALVLLWPTTHAQTGPTSVSPLVDAGLTESRRAPPTGPTSQPSAGDAGAMTAAEPGVIARFGWGSGPGQLGRNRPDEANPEAPMSFAVDSNGTTWVLDQVNNRLVKVDRSGQSVGTVPLTLQAPQDVTVAKDGTVVVMDRLVDKAVALVGPDGKQLGELKLEGKGLAEGGATTGVFTDGKSVLVEREHGDLVKLGTTDGKADAERPEVPGRPSRDGTSYLSASIGDAPSGQVLVTVIEQQTREHRFTRRLVVGPPVVALTLLDSDGAGIIYLGALVEVAGSTPEARRFTVSVTCLDPRDGHPLGKATLPANDSADETFRELTVPDEGGVLYLRRTEQGAQLVRASCQ
jgi:hypothetical protein